MELHNVTAQAHDIMGSLSPSHASQGESTSEGRRSAVNGVSDATHGPCYDEQDSMPAESARVGGSQNAALLGSV